MKKLVVGLGEVLWDMLPGRKYLGGAPANFAYITNLLGDEGVVASRVGTDDLGREAIQRMERLRLPVVALQSDPTHPRGMVNVSVDQKGFAQYKIEEPSAWDFLQWTPEWQTLARNADAVCFGSLAQRSEQSRATIRSFVQATRPEAVRIFDVNLRAPFYSWEVLDESLQRADIAKMNDEELPKIMDLAGLARSDEKSSAQSLMKQYKLKLVCITRGARGSLLVGQHGHHEIPAVPVKVADTIGAGDAFTAALVREYLRGSTLEKMNQAANRVGAWVASQAGPTPIPKDGALQLSLAEI